MKKTHPIAITVILIAIGAGAAGGFFAYRSQSHSSPELLAGKMFFVDLGVQTNAGRGGGFTVPVSLANNSSGRIWLRQASTSCSCTHLELPVTPIEPHGTVELRLAFNNPGGQYGGYFDGKAVITTTDGKANGQFSIEFAGLDLRPISVVPPRLNFGALPRHGPSEPLSFAIFVPRIALHEGHVILSKEIAVAKIDSPPGILCRAETLDHDPHQDARLPPVLMKLNDSQLSGTQLELKKLLSRSDSDPSLWHAFHFKAEVLPTFRDQSSSIEIAMTDGAKIRLPLVTQSEARVTLTPSVVTVTADETAMQSTIDVLASDADPLEIKRIDTRNALLESEIRRISPSQLRIILIPKDPHRNFSTNIQVEMNAGTATVPYSQRISRGK